MTQVDHPRIRGEHSQSMLFWATKPGSSPHPRGALDTVNPPLAAKGIIPASAGSTTISRYPRIATEDHPRIRGEHCRALR